MKKTMTFTILILAAIVIVSSFGFQLSSSSPVSVPASMSGHALYVCPVTRGQWTMVADIMHRFGRYIIGGFFFVTIILMFNWGWALYQNLVKDSFNRDSFKNVWQFTKVTFWAGVVVAILAWTPDYFKTVHIRGASGEWVLCENNTPGARAVRSDAVLP